MLYGRADEEIQALKELGIAVEVVPGVTAALAGAASMQQSLTLRGVARSVAFITLAQGTENIALGQPISNPSADTLVYYMGRKDAARIAQQLIEQSPNQNSNTPVKILEAVSTPRERLWVSTLQELAAGKADQWFDSSSPALIMIGEALRANNLEGSCSKIDNRLQDSHILTNSLRSA
jgi:uroporphyrin-III C-methyltransferase